MGLSGVVIFALLWTGQCTGEKSSSSVSTEDLSNIKSTDPSTPHRRHARRGIFSKASAVKDEDRSILDPDIFLDLVQSQTPPEDAYAFEKDNKKYYITVTGKCNKVKVESFQPSPNDKTTRQFIVNKNDFEILQWTTWEDIKRDQTPFTPVWLCKDNYIYKDQNGMAVLKKTKGNENLKTEVLTLNSAIKWQRLEIDSYNPPLNKPPGHVEVLKQFILINKNCESTKYVMKLDGGSDKTMSSQKGSSHTFGVGLEGSVSGTTPTFINLGGKLNLKYDYSRSKSITITNVDKLMHSVSMEVQVKPKHSCTVDITSTTVTEQVSYSGQLTRKYKNGEEHVTSVTDIIAEQEISDLQASVNRCTAITEGEKC